MNKPELTEYLSRIVSVEEALYETQMLRDNLLFYRACYAQMLQDGFVSSVNKGLEDPSGWIGETNEKFVTDSWFTAGLTFRGAGWPEEEFAYGYREYEDAGRRLGYEYTTRLMNSAIAHFTPPQLPEKPEEPQPLDGSFPKKSMTRGSTQAAG